MINAEKLAEKLYGIVGFRQPFNPSYQKVDAANLISRSGYFVNDNPFAKIESVYDSQDYTAISDANFNLLLKRKQQDSIVSICNAVFNESDFIDRQMLYQYAMNKVNTEVLPVGFIGHRIKISTDKDIAFSIKRILLNFSGTGTFKLLLFNTAIKAPIKSKEVTIASDFQEEVLDWTIDFTDKYSKGEFYIGYINNGTLVPTPFKRDYELSNIESIVTHLCIEKITIPNHTTELLWDLSLVQSADLTTGLNPDIIVYEDFTDIIINSEKLFAYAIGLDLTINCLSEIIASLRSNKTERSGTLNIVRLTQEIEGQTGNEVINITGLRPRLYGAISQIRKEIKKLKDGYSGYGIMVVTQ